MDCFAVLVMTNGEVDAEKWPPLAGGGVEVAGVGKWPDAADSAARLRHSLSPPAK